MRGSRVVFGFGIALAAVLLLIGANNWLFDQRQMELVVIEEDMVLQKEEGLYFILPSNPELKLELPEELLEEVIYGNPYAITYSYNKLSKKGYVQRLKVT